MKAYLKKSEFMFDGFTQKMIQVENNVTINLVIGGKGAPLLLLHGYPETHLMWHKIAPRLAEHFTVIAPDLRGYGDSSKPPSKADHSTYSKRATANDLIQLMDKLNFDHFYLAGHDRGARVAHRLVLDHRSKVIKLALLDIIPTYKVFQSTNKTIAMGYYHWFFLAQEDGLPERMIGADPEYYITEKLARWSRKNNSFPPEVMRDYIRCFSNTETIHATCEDYRAAASIDLMHDEENLQQKITCPLLVLWSQGGLMDTQFDVLACWRERANQVEGHAIDCGHFLPEEAPNETYEALYRFLVA